MAKRRIVPFLPTDEFHCRYCGVVIERLYKRRLTTPHGVIGSFGGSQSPRRRRYYTPPFRVIAHARYGGHCHVMNAESRHDKPEDSIRFGYLVRTRFGETFAKSLGSTLAIWPEEVPLPHGYRRLDGGTVVSDARRRAS